MISIRKTATELDRLADLHQAAAECYGLGIQSIAEYFVHVEPQPAEEFRRHLDRLREQWRAAGAPAEMRDVQSSLRGELREYHANIHEQLSALRKQLDATTSALNTLAEGVAARGADHEKHVTQEVEKLQTLCQSEDLAEIRAGVQSAARGIRGHLEDMRVAHQVMIAQLTDEIRMLHQECEAERRAFFTDAASGAWNRQKMAARIGEVLKRKEPFRIVMIRLEYPQQWKEPRLPGIKEGALKAAVTRLQKLLGEEAMIGRWSPDHFIAILPIEVRRVDDVCREIELHLSGDHPVQADGVSHHVRFDVAARMLDQAEGDDAAAFTLQLERLEAALVN